MTTPSPAVDDIDSAFDSAALVEEQCYNKGFEEGVKKGEEESFQEGIEFGIKFGLKFGQELGFIHGFCSELLLQVDNQNQEKEKESHSHSHHKINPKLLQSIITSIENFKADPNKSHGEFDKIRLQFKRIRSILKLPQSSLFEVKNKDSLSF